MLSVKPVPDVDILFTFVTVYLSVFFLPFSYCLPVSGEIKLYKNVVRCGSAVGVVCLVFERRLWPWPLVGHRTVLARATFCRQSAHQRRGVVVSGVRRMNEVNARRARLVPGWVTVFGRVYHLGMQAE